MAEEQNLPEQTSPEPADTSEDELTEERLLSDDEVVELQEPATMLRGEEPQPMAEPARLQPERIKRETGGSFIDAVEERLGDMSTPALVWTGIALFLVLVVLGLIISNSANPQPQVVSVATNTPSPTQAPAPAVAEPESAPAASFVSENAVEIVVAVAGPDESLADAIQSSLRAASVGAGEAIILTVQYAGEGIPTSEGAAQTLRAEQDAAIFIWPQENNGQVTYQFVTEPDFAVADTQLVERGLGVEDLPASRVDVASGDEPALDAAVFNTTAQLAFLLGDYQASASLFSRVQSAGLLTQTGSSNLNALNLYLALSRFISSGDSPDVMQSLLLSFTAQPERLLSELGYSVPGDVSGAAAQFEAVLAENSEDVAALIGLSRVNILQGDYVAAVNNAAAAAQLEPTNPDALLLQSVARYLSGDYLGALEPLDQSLDANPEDQRAYAIRALSHMSLGQYELALSDFDAALPLQTDIVLLGRAIALDQLGDLVATLALYQSFFADYSTQGSAEATVNVILTSRIDSLSASVQQEQEAAAATQSAAQARATEAIQLTATAIAGPTQIPFANEESAPTEVP